MDTSKLGNSLLSPWAGLMIIAFAAFLVYSNTLASPFVFDDKTSIVENNGIRDLSAFSSPERFLRPRSVVDFTFALNYRFGALDVFGYHLVNILIHIINGFVAYFLSRAILKLLMRPPGAREGAQRSKLPAQGKRGKGTKKEVLDAVPQRSILDLQCTIPAISLFAALIFVVHPLQTQAVTYIVQRYASLAAFFYMSSVLFYLQGRRLSQRSKAVANGMKRYAPSALYALSIICGLLAFMSKQNTASLPAAIILVEWICFGASWKERARRLLWFIPVTTLFAVFVLYAVGVFGEAEIVNVLEDVSERARETDLVSRWSYLCTQFTVLVLYIRLFFFPVGQNLDYLYPFKEGFLDGFTPLAFTLLAGLAILAIWVRKRYPVVTIAVFWFFITLSVESGIIPISDAIFEHRLYLPLFGFALFAAWLSFRLLPKRRIHAVLICVSIVLLLGVLTFQRNGIWQDRVTLWTDVVTKSPHNTRAYVNLGNACAEEGRYDEALQCHSRVLKIKPHSAKANYNMGVVLGKKGDTDEAISYYLKTLGIDPDYEDAHYNLGSTLEDLGDLEGAAHHYLEVLRIHPSSVKTHTNLGVTLSRLGDLDGALEHFQKAVRIEPHNAIALNNLGSALMMSGDLTGAARCLSEALESRPDYADAHYNVGTALALQGDPDGAIRHLSEAVRINPDYAKARYDLGNLLANQGRLDEAIRHLSEAVRLRPDDNVPVCYNIACAYARQNMRRESITWLKKAVEGGFDRWDLLTSDKDLENIRETDYYRSLIGDHGTGDRNER